MSIGTRTAAKKVAQVTRLVWHPTLYNANQVDGTLLHPGDEAKWCGECGWLDPQTGGNVELQGEDDNARIR